MPPTQKQIAETDEALERESEEPNAEADQVNESTDPDPL